MRREERSGACGRLASWNLWVAIWNSDETAPTRCGAALCRWNSGRQLHLSSIIPALGRFAWPGGSCGGLGSGTAAAAMAAGLSDGLDEPHAANDSLFHRTTCGASWVSSLRSLLSAGPCEKRPGIASMSRTRRNPGALSHRSTSLPCVLIAKPGGRQPGEWLSLRREC